MKTVLFLILTAISLHAQQPGYDLLLKGGHVIDPKNNISKIMDVAIADGRFARVAENIPAAQAKTVADVGGLYVTPGLVDIHVHVYTGTVLRASTAKTDTNVQADAFSFRSRDDDGGRRNVGMQELSGFPRRCHQEVQDPDPGNAEHCQRRDGCGRR